MLHFPPVFCPPGVHPSATVEWGSRDIVIAGPTGAPVFAQPDVDCPTTWSESAAAIVASKYFRGHVGAPGRESSIYDPIERVTDTLHDWLLDGYTDAASAQTARDDLAWLILHQHFSFNSPVWFGVGAKDDPQCSACFIGHCGDSITKVMATASISAGIYKEGGGFGCSLSAIRHNGAEVSGGGYASGPVSFGRILDTAAGAIKSGGTTRRAALMLTLDCDHPDVEAFIDCNRDSEKKAHALIDAGFDGGFNVPGGAYDSVPYQNANLSVRVTDDFMHAAIDGEAWNLVSRTTGATVRTVFAGDILTSIAEAAHFCGDPGMQFDTTINDWHTCPASGLITSSNPCSEFVFLDNTACNLGSMNLDKFRNSDGTFAIDRFVAAVRLAITAMDAIVENSSYPTPEIARNSHDYRPLGLGFANLGALLMSLGLPYDSGEGRALAAAITSLMAATAYHQSSVLAEKLGPFAGFEANRDPMLRVIGKHLDAAAILAEDCIDNRDDDLATAIATAAYNLWLEAKARGKIHGYRNAQVTVLAPTGTIGFMMGCDTTGIEPDYALVKFKKLVGGGYMKIVNGTVRRALQSLGYDTNEATAIVDHLEAGRPVDTAPRLKPAHRAVFACANDIHPSGHLRMMAACQPFLSGAISKTVNVPKTATVQEIRDIYVEAWKRGLKAVAVYRDGCKRTQPLNAAPSPDATPTPSTRAETPAEPQRRRLPETCAGIRHKFSIAGHDGYIHVGLYGDGAPGELFVQMSKEGSTLSGIVDQWATAVSIGLQYGIPLSVLTDKMSGARFEPSGFTGNPDIPIALSITDYIGRWLSGRFLSPEPAVLPTVTQAPTQSPSIDASGPPCTSCGTLTRRAGACYVCPQCGTTTGCG